MKTSERLEMNNTDLIAVALKSAVHIFFVIACVSYLACQHSPAVVEFPDTASASVEMESFYRDLNLAIDEQLPVFSPSFFDKARRALVTARGRYSRDEDSQKVLHEVALGRAYLRRAHEVARDAKEHMAEVASARLDAMKVNAHVLFLKEFEKADEHLRKLARKAEDNDFSDAERSRGILVAGYLELELEAIKQGSLTAIQEKIAQAQKENAKVFAPHSLMEAENELKSVESFITANRHEARKIRNLVDKALARADHLLKITLEAKNANRKSPEELALELEAKDRIVKKERQAKSGLVREKASLEHERDFNQLFEKARSHFSEGEAEVFRKGNTLVIRLHGLQFPVARAVLSGENFALLEKVKLAVRELNPKEVRIEGHTDSTGSKRTNYHLSNARADAISKFLVQSEVIASSRVATSGYGDEKPIASNKSVEGRARNRRVDIEIVPGD